MVHPVVVVGVHGIRCSAKMDTKAGSSYAYVALISKMNRNPDQRKYKRIEIMMTWTSQKIETYKVQVFNIRGVLSLPTILSKVEKETLLTIPNPEWI